MPSSAAKMALTHTDTRAERATMAIEAGREMNEWRLPLLKAATEEAPRCIRLCALVPLCRQAVLDERVERERRRRNVQRLSKGPSTPPQLGRGASYEEAESMAKAFHCSEHATSAARWAHPERCRRHTAPFIKRHAGVPPDRVVVAAGVKTERALCRPFLAQQVSAMTSRPAAFRLSYDG